MFEFTSRNTFFLPHISSHIELKLSRGGVHVFTGENGIGKSTLLQRFYDSSKLKDKIILGQQKSGEIFFDRRLSTYRNILESHSNVIDLTFFQKFWEKAGLKGKEDRLLSHLSGGEVQILKLISLCSSEGEVYFFDEPGQSLDREKKKLVSEMFTCLLEKKKSLLIVEHDCSWLPAGSLVTELEVNNSELREKTSWTI